MSREKSVICRIPFHDLCFKSEKQGTEDCQCLCHIEAAVK